MWRSKVLEGGNGMPGREEEEGACLTDARVKNGDRYRLYIQVITSVQCPEIFSKKKFESKRRTAGGWCWFPRPKQNKTKKCLEGFPILNEQQRQSARGAKVVRAADLITLSMLPASNHRATTSIL